MCEINPKHSARFKLEFFTSVPMTAEEFEAHVTQWALIFEMAVNKTGILRCHVHELESPEALNELESTYCRGCKRKLEAGEFCYCDRDE